MSHRPGDQAAGRIQGPTPGSRTHPHLVEPLLSQIHTGEEKAADYLGMLRLVSAVITYRCTGLFGLTLNHHHYLACSPCRSLGGPACVFIPHQTPCTLVCHTRSSRSQSMRGPIPVSVGIAKRPRSGIKVCAGVRYIDAEGKSGSGLGLPDRVTGRPPWANVCTPSLRAGCRRSARPGRCAGRGNGAGRSY